MPDGDNNDTGPKGTGVNQNPAPQPAAVPLKPRRLLGIREVEHLTGISRATIYRKLKEQKVTGKKLFPKQRQSGPGRVGWLDNEIQSWIDSLPVPD